MQRTAVRTDTEAQTLRRQRRRYAGLIDLENLAIVRGQLLRADEMEHLLDGLSSLLAGIPVRVASATPVLRGYTGLLCDAGWGLSVVDRTRNAADQALLTAAHDFIAAGVTDLVVLSGDHAFATLAIHARLHVVAHRGQISNALLLAASTVLEIRGNGSPIPVSCGRPTADADPLGLRAPAAPTAVAS